MNKLISRLNLSNPFCYISLFFIVVISRIPLLNLGFGYDIDGWVETNFAFYTFNTFDYLPSRGLGHPVYELFLSVLIGISEQIDIPGWVLTNTVMLFISIFCVIFLFRILALWEAERKEAIVIFFCFLPVIWKNSSMTVDFMFSLMLLLISQYLAILKKYDFSAIALGFACGARFQNGLFLLPMIYLVLSQTRGRKKEAVRFVIIFVLLTLIFLIPFIRNYGGSVYERYKEVANLESTAGMYLLKAGFRGIYRFIGIDAAIFLIVSLLFGALSVKKLFSSVRENDERIVFSLIVFVLFLLLFAKYPFKQEYMLPLVPSAMMLLSHVLNKKAFYAFFIIMILNGFFTVPALKIQYSPEGRIFPEISFFGKGPFLEHVDKRKELLELKKFVESGAIKNHSVVIWHRYQMPYVYYNRYKILNSGQYRVEDKSLIPLAAVYDEEKDIYFTSSAVLPGMSKEKIEETLREKNVYYIPCTIKLVKNKLGINLLDFNPILIKQLRPNEY